MTIRYVCLDCGEDQEGLLDGWVFINFSDTKNPDEYHPCPKCGKVWTLKGLLTGEELLN